MPPLTETIRRLSTSRPRATFPNGSENKDVINPAPHDIGTNGENLQETLSFFQLARIYKQSNDKRAPVIEAFVPPPHHQDDVKSKPSAESFSFENPMLRETREEEEAAIRASTDVRFPTSIGDGQGVGVFRDVRSGEVTYAARPRNHALELDKKLYGSKKNLFDGTVLGTSSLSSSTSTNRSSSIMNDFDTSSNHRDSNPSQRFLPLPPPSLPGPTAVAPPPGLGIPPPQRRSSFSFVHDTRTSQTAPHHNTSRKFATVYHGHEPLIPVRASTKKSSMPKEIDTSQQRHSHAFYISPPSPNTHVNDTTPVGLKRSTHVGIVKRPNNNNDLDNYTTNEIASRELVARGSLIELQNGARSQQFDSLVQGWAERCSVHSQRFKVPPTPENG